MKRDQKFFDMYSLVIGALALVALLIYVGSTQLARLTQDVYTTDAAEYQAAVLSRIAPFGQVYLPGEETAADRPQVATATPAEPVATTLSGPQVYNTACLMCHGSGIGGAPILGDAATWGPRIAQGTETLHLHAIEGYAGATGFMPPKGGRLDLSDDEIRAAVDYMAGEVAN